MLVVLLPSGGNLNVGGVLTYEDVTNIDSLGIITARSGVSIADSIFHTGDTNTAIRFPGTDTVSLETSGSEALRVDSSGRLLIATTSSVPANIDGIGYANLLQVQGGATGEGVSVANTADFARINMVRKLDVATNTELGTISFSQSSGVIPLSGHEFHVLVKQLEAMAVVVATYVFIHLLMGLINHLSGCV